MLNNSGICVVALVIALACFSCNSNEKQYKKVPESRVISLAQNDTIRDSDYLNHIVATSCISSTFFHLLKVLDSLGFQSDSIGAERWGYYASRIHKVNKFKCDNRWFYKLDTLSDPVFGLGHKLSLPCYKYYKSLTGYYFMWNIRGYKADAFVIEWHFKDSVAAKMAVDDIKNVVYDADVPIRPLGDRHEAFFNSDYLVSQVRENVYTFVSRSSFANAQMPKIFKGIDSRLKKM